MADSNQDALKHKLVQHPAWYDPDTNFGHPRYAFALRVGGRVASKFVSGSYHAGCCTSLCLSASWLLSAMQGTWRAAA